MDVSNRVGHRANNVKFTPTFRLTFMGRVIQISSISGCLTVLFTLWSVAVSDPLLIPPLLCTRGRTESVSGG